MHGSVAVRVQMGSNCTLIGSSKSSRAIYLRMVARGSRLRTAAIGRTPRFNQSVKQGLTPRTFYSGLCVVPDVEAAFRTAGPASGAPAILSSRTDSTTLGLLTSCLLR